MPDEEVQTDAATENTETSEAAVTDEGASGDAGEGTEKQGSDDASTTEADAQAAADAKAADDAAEPGERKRKTAADFINERREKREAKAAEAARNAAAGGSADDGSGEQEGDDVPESDQTAIRRVAGEMIRPMVEKHLEAEDRLEVDEFLSKEGNEDFKQYKDKALKWMNHPSRRNLPIETVFLDVVGRDGLLRMGAERARRADEKARSTQSGGGTSREDGVGKNFWEMTDAEMEAEQERVRSGNS